jgi:type 1 glutamine amidotransferase
VDLKPPHPLCLHCGALALALLSLGVARAEPGHVFAPLTPAETQAIRAALPAIPRAHPARPRRVLIFYRTDGFVHDSIPSANLALQELGARSGAYRADLSEDLGAFTFARLAAYDAVILNNSTHLDPTPAQRTALRAFVMHGKGLVGIHGASDSFYTWPDGQVLLGGIFNGHPWSKDDTVAVKIDDPHSPLTAAFEARGFWIKDEIYQIDGPYGRNRVHVLLSLDMAHPENARPPAELIRHDNDFPIAWIRREGQGRVFYTSLGHNPEVLRTPPLLQHYLDGIQYAIGDLPADATPSANLEPPPTAAPAPADRARIIDEPRPGG